MARGLRIVLRALGFPSGRRSGHSRLVLCRSSFPVCLSGGTGGINCGSSVAASFMRARRFTPTNCEGVFPSTNQRVGSHSHFCLYNIYIHHNEFLYNLSSDLLLWLGVYFPPSPCYHLSSFTLQYLVSSVSAEFRLLWRIPNREGAHRLGHEACG